LLVELARRADVVAVVGDGAFRTARAPAGVPVVARSGYDARSVDLDIYHFGNEARFHGYMYEAIRRRPGMLVLHDPALPDFHHELCGGYCSTLFLDECRFDGPEVDTAYPVRYVDARVEVDWLRLPLARRVVEASALTVVHSAWVRDTLASRYPRATIVHRHHAALVGEEASPERSDVGAVNFGVFGSITRPKRIASVIAALAEVRREGARARLVVCGRSDPDGLVVAEARAAIEQFELGDSVLLRVDVADDEMTRLVTGCDAVIALRWPTVGETSGPVMAAFGIGRLVIASDVPQNREFDARFCWRVPVGDEEIAVLAQKMRQVIADPGSAWAAGAAARDFVRREASFAIVASQQLELAQTLIKPAAR
jgi:glycosyltransferase involved in cell wall biosynthesis